MVLLAAPAGDCDGFGFGFGCGVVSAAAAAASAVAAAVADGLSGEGEVMGELVPMALPFRGGVGGVGLVAALRSARPLR